MVALADLAEFRDSDTGNHVLRVQRLTDAIAGQMRDNGAYPELMSKEFMDMVGMASILHDVGKVGTPDHILFKPGKLDPDERVIMEQHATIGAQILARSASMVEGMSYLSLGSEIAGGHHEHFDGNGYPRKQKAHEIPLSARIVAVVDVFDALLNKRPYKEPWTLRDTMDYISGRAGSQFDPEVVRALETLVKERRLQDLPDE
ncbi:HD domain-containing protein [Chromobacterium haemolyticum]|nr:HD domain-containing protein [Chromobacterium haemolyticum]